MIENSCDEPGLLDGVLHYGRDREIRLYCRLHKYPGWLLKVGSEVYDKRNPLRTGVVSEICSAYVVVMTTFEDGHVGAVQFKTESAMADLLYVWEKIEWDDPRKKR